MVSRLFVAHVLVSSILMRHICSTTPLCEFSQRLSRQVWGILTSVNMPEREMKRVWMVTSIKGQCESFHSSRVFIS